MRTPTLILHDPENDYIPFGAACYLHDHISASRLEASDELVSPTFGDALFQAIETFIDEVSATRAQ